MAQACDKLGKTAVAKDTPIIPTGTARKLSANVKMAKDPTLNVVAIAVIAITFKLAIIKLGTLGNKRKNVSRTPG